MEKCDDNRIEIGEIAESIKCSKIRLIKYMNECEELEKKKLIRCSRSSGRLSYRVPAEVREALRKNNEYRPASNENLSIEKFFTVLEKLFKERNDEELTYETLTGELLNLIEQNMHLKFCKKIMNYGLSEYDLILLVCFCHLAGNNNDDNIGTHDIEFLYEDKYEIKRMERNFSNGTHVLLDSKFIEFNNDNGFVNKESWKLSDMAKKELLSELDVNISQNYKKNLILFDTIKPKKMFYNSRETGEIQTLISLLSNENYLQIQKRLDEKGMRKGFACLFSGPPGTGKTETVYQIARETKRNIMECDHCKPERKPSYYF